MKYLKHILIGILFVITLFWFVFALISGSETYSGGVKGIFMNSPNALPWLLLFGFVYLAWKFPKEGGLVIVILGVISVFLFHAYESMLVLFAISIPIILLGTGLVASWYINK